MHVVMWKKIYINYQLHHLDLIFVQETLKYYLCAILKELKIRINNEEGQKHPHCNVMNC
jgi:hypothetical protein